MPAYAASELPKGWRPGLTMSKAIFVWPRGRRRRIAPATRKSVGEDIVGANIGGNIVALYIDVSELLGGGQNFRMIITENDKVKKKTGDSCVLNF